MPKDKISVTPATALVLFDIDGTLIRRAGPHHREALVDAVRAVTGVETTTDHIPVHGMLDPDILTRMMQDVGMTPPQIRRSMPAIIHKAQALYVRRCPDLSGKTCPGVRLLLSRLQRKGIPLALVTGNLTRIGWRKMERCGLRDYFQYGAFAEMARDRAGLARLAISHARRHGWINRDAVVTLIGDGITVDELAHHFGTIGYEVLTSLGKRYARIYKGGNVTAEPPVPPPAEPAAAST
jgi:phosphoglycolate phosphatase-like HAD superfamily hydrolase